MIHKCTKCGSIEVDCWINKKQIGIWCKECGKWIKWLNKEEIKYYKPTKYTLEVAKATKKVAIDLNQ